MDSLRFRSTTVASDEALCLAVIFDLDFNIVTEGPTLQRTLELLSLLSGVPMSPLFWDLPPFSKIEGFRWALKTLMCLRGTFGVASRAMAVDTPIWQGVRAWA